jgi:hypothetical protein
VPRDAPFRASGVWSQWAVAEDATLADCGWAGPESKRWEQNRGSLAGGGGRPCPDVPEEGRRLRFLRQGVRGAVLVAWDNGQGNGILRLRGRLGVVTTATHRIDTAAMVCKGPRRAPGEHPHDLAMMWQRHTLLIRAGVVVDRR